jgi:hypothetical protein
MPGYPLCAMDSSLSFTNQRVNFRVHDPEVAYEPDLLYGSPMAFNFLRST